MSRIFISCSSKDTKPALTLCKAIEARGYPCWLASRDVGAGQNFQEEIVLAIRAAPLMVLVFSANANTSSEVKKELALASQAQLVVVPVRLEDIAPSGAFVYELAIRQWIDLFDDWDGAIDQLVQRLDLAIPPSTGAPPRAAPKSRALVSGKRARLLAAGGLAALLLAGGVWFSRTAPPSHSAADAPRLNAKVQQVVDMARVIERRARISAKKARTAALRAEQAQMQAEAAARKAEGRAAGYGIVTIKNEKGVTIRWAGQVLGGRRDGFAVVTGSGGQRLAG
ncbi:MAG TPA: toll/interleukin-1 receptor domain-containing protein, partial [Rhizomicrobium sp.]|nr:toll/interleukin-1 receptor domain-containing protein [Rhizomicrobium sp.]